MTVRIYTRTGDAGETALFGGGRVPKDHPRIEACGTVDELNAVLGRALTAATDPELGKRLATVQHDLFTLGAHLAATEGSDGKTHGRLPPLPHERPEEMERWMDDADADLEPLTEFILPGGAPAAVELHVCRTVCRRAERAVVRLERAGGDGSDGPKRTGAPATIPDTGATTDATRFAVRYLNRLSDLLFVLARLENHRAGIPDTTWRR